MYLRIKVAWLNSGEKTIVCTYTQSLLYIIVRLCL